MTRGRKKDLTIPPTRALAQQRDYRARKAQYVADLEDRCRRAEEENIRLRQELAVVRGGPIPTIFGQQTAQASSELMESLTLASESIARFQQLMFSGRSSGSAEQSNGNRLRPASFPSPGDFPLHPRSSSTNSHMPQPPEQQMRGGTSPGPSRLVSSRSPSPDSECCGGIMDCQNLIEESDIEDEEEEEDEGNARMRISGLRSTSDFNSQ
ncbi:hypothetical protein BD779DRAFT_1797838 [Infundibulicybe gibba]|nr:hypothetical protein BD779DRAFT_1797838 [Infundibulicybe gibba]